MALFAVDFNLANIGGPSAGLMFSWPSSTSSPPVTSTAASSSPAPEPSARMATSARSAASPTRCPAPAEAGATVFLVPADNCDEARTAGGNTMELLKADNLNQTIDSLKALTSGGNPAR